MSWAMLSRPISTRNLRHVLSHHSRYSTHTPPPPSSDWSQLLQSVWNITRFGAIAYTMQAYVFSTTMSVGPSMLPTFAMTGDVLLADYMSARLRIIKSGDVVVATKPTDPRVSILKRVRGMPGETIWVHPASECRPVELVVPDAHVWLEGDNRHQSTDSRDYGPVPICLVRGKIWARIWPLPSACWVRTKVIDHTRRDRERASARNAHAKQSSASRAVASDSVVADDVKRPS